MSPKSTTDGAGNAVGPTNPRSPSCLAAIALPIVGAIRAADGNYYRYPVVGVTPDVVPLPMS
jgi:hypothetical protein